MKQKEIEKIGSISLHIDRVRFAGLDNVFPYFRFYLIKFDADIIYLKHMVEYTK